METELICQQRNFVYEHKELTKKMEEKNYGAATDGAHVKQIEDENKPKEVVNKNPLVISSDKIKPSTETKVVTNEERKEKTIDYTNLK